MRNRVLKSGRSLKSQFFLAAAAASVVPLFTATTHGQLTYLSSFGTSGSGPGQFIMPTGIAVGPDGVVYVVDEVDDNAQYFTPTGGYLGSFNTALFAPFGVAVSPNGSVYIPDDNERVDVFNSTGILQGTFGTPGVGHGQFSGPQGVALSPSGALYVADSNNNRVQQFSVTGSSATFVNTFGSIGSANGQFNDPLGAAVGPTGNVYIGDTENNRVQVFSSAGVYQSTITGSNGPFNEPADVAVSSIGTVYVSDYNNSRVETFNSSGALLQTVAVGSGAPAGFGQPLGIAIAPNGVVYVAEAIDSRIDRFFDPSAWVSGTNSFNNLSTGPLGADVGPTGILGTSLTLTPAMSLNAFDFSVDVGGTFTQAGGALVTAGGITSTGIAGNFIYQSGSFSAAALTVVTGGSLQAVQGGALTVTSTASLGGRVTLDGGVALTSPTLNITSGGLLTMNNANVSAGSINISSGAQVQMYSSTSSVLTAPVANSGLLIGAGQINGALTNGTSGQVTVNLSQNLTISGSGSTNAGLINVGGGMLEFTQLATNQTNGTINGFGSLYFNGGLINSGAVSLAGSASVFGAVVNNSTGTIRLTGNTPNVFFNPVASSGSLTVDAGASGSIFGTYTGSGPIVNNGALFLHATSVSGVVSGSGNLTVGAVGAPTGLQLLPDTATSTQASVTVSSGSTLDLTNNALQLNFRSAANDPSSTLVPQLIAGRNGGAWTGAGITSSSAAANSVKFSLGYADGNTDMGTSAAANQFVIQYTLAGDTNLDGAVGFADLVAVAQNFGSMGRDWAHGNLTYDPSGSIGFADLVIVAQQFGDTTPVASGGGAASISPAWQAAQNQSVIPEPTAAALLTAAAAGLLSRRRPKS